MASRRLPEVPKRPYMASRWFQDGLKMGPTWLQGQPQDGPKRAPRLDETLISEYRVCVVHSSLFSCVFKKTRLASTRRSFWASPWARNPLWRAPDGASFSFWAPRRAQDAPGPHPKRAQAQKRRLASTRRSCVSTMSVSSRRGSFFLFLRLKTTCPPHNRSQVPGTLFPLRWHGGGECRRQLDYYSIIIL